MKKEVRLQALLPKIWAAGKLGIAIEFFVVSATGAPRNAGEARALGLVDPTEPIEHHKTMGSNKSNKSTARTVSAESSIGSLKQLCIEDKHRGYGWDLQTHGVASKNLSFYP